MKNKHWTAIGASYAVFAIAIATLATYQTSSTRTSVGPAVVAQTDQSPVWRSERLYQSDENPRRDLFLTIWSTRDCFGCQQQEAEIPALRAAGYNVTLRKVPAPRWVKSFPTTVVTRDSIGGEEVTRYSGAKTLAEVDEILKIGETPEDEDEEVENDEDYNIFRPKAQTLWKPEWYKLYVRHPMNRKQAGEVEILRDMGFKIVFADALDDKEYPNAVLVYVRGPGGPVCIKTWFGPFTAEDVLEEVRPPAQDVKSQVNTLNLVVWLSENEECDRQYEEIAKLRKLGFSANVYMVETRKRPKHILRTPTVILIDNRRDHGVCALWARFVTAEEILDALL